METSAFMDKSKKPTLSDLQQSIGDGYTLWKEIRNYAFAKYPDAVEEWNFPGKKYGWSFRIKDKKRAIVYLLPRKKSFMVALVFGKKAYNQIMESTISDEIKSELQAAKPYAEGRGIRIPIENADIIPHIKKLIDIKIAN